MSRDVGIDLGTANTLIYVKGKGVVIREPSVVAIDRTSDRILAVGNLAKEMLGRTPRGISAIKPMQDGVIANFKITSFMIKYFLKKVSGTFFRPKVIICVPYGVTQVERRAIEEVVLRAGAKEVLLLEETLAAAIGAGLPIEEPVGSMIVNIGAGTSEVALVSLGGIVISKSFKVAGNKLDEAIALYIRKRYNLMVGDRMAENIKIAVGSVGSFDKSKPFKSFKARKMNVRGRDIVSGLPKTVRVSSDDVTEAIGELIINMVDVVRSIFEKAPPELASDVMEHGVILTGGGALIRGLNTLISGTINTPVFIAENPLDSVINGIGKVIEEYDKREGVLSKKQKSIN